MLGAIIGDIVGSTRERNNVKTEEAEDETHRIHDCIRGALMAGAMTSSWNMT